MKARELDLKKLLSFNAKGGIIHFMGHRALLLDAVAMGLLRKELIENLGIFAARNILTRMGYAHGWRTAENLHTEYPDLLQDTACGPTLHMLQGMTNIPTCDISFDPTFRMFTVWEDSYEAEQHVLHLGMTTESVCWTMTGYVSGYCSRMLGQEVYCIEDECCAKGDPHCHNVARLKEDWGADINPHLPFFHTETIDVMLKDVTTKLQRSEQKIYKLQQLIGNDAIPSGIIASSKIMRQTLNLAKRIAKVDSSVVVTGESGVGKEMIARFIHKESMRDARPFLAVNCGAVAETLLESEFFGHTKGAFTGADKERLGLFEAANGGTLFLDEVGEISLNMQVKLLRVLQEKEIRRVGENSSRPVDVRIIAATNRDLADEVAAGRFRKDLYYRLCIFELTVPPLRERPDDILPLAKLFLDKAAQTMKRQVIGFNPQVTDLLQQYCWPGNVRQLQNTIEHAVALCNTKRICLNDLPKIMRLMDPHITSAGVIRPIDDVEREHILAAIQAVSGDKALAARGLGISLSSLYQKLKRYSDDGSRPRK